MRSDLTDITLVVDRSGSMQSIRSDAEGGVNAFLRQQAREPGEAFVTLIQFDHDYDFVHRGVPIRECSEYKLVPRGSTALLDTLGRAITETGIRLNLMTEAERPALVIVVIMTDGQENASREFTRERVREMIEHQQQQYHWQFTFLGANQDAFAEAGLLGVDPTASARFSPDKVADSLKATSNKISRMRQQVLAQAPPDNSFTEAERQAMQ